MLPADFAFGTFFQGLVLGELFVFVPWLVIVTKPMRVKDQWPLKRATLHQRRLVASGEHDIYENSFTFFEDNHQSFCVSRNSYIGTSTVGQEVTIYIDPNNPRYCYEAISVRRILTGVLVGQGAILFIALLSGFHTGWKTKDGGSN